MAIINPTTTPANYSVPSVTRYGLISELNIVNVHAYDKFIEKYNFMPYVLVNQLAGSEVKEQNKQMLWYESRGRYLGFVTASADVSVANNAPATVTVGAGSYSESGTRSLPSIGMVFYNSRTGVESKVTAVDKNTPNAHTFTLLPVSTGTNASVLAGDELLSRGFKYLGEQSDKTETIIRDIDKYSNYITQLRADDTIGDLSAAEKIEFQIDGNYSYTYKQMRDTNLRLLWELELLIMEGRLSSNLTGEEGSNGVISQVQANGINGTYSTFGITTTFGQLNRALNAVGAPKEYDILSDNSSYQEIQNAIAFEINNGSIVYADKASSRGGIDLERDFNSFKIYGRKYNLTNYQLFDEQTMYGSSGLGLRNRFSLYVPVGNTSGMNERNVSVTVPRFCIAYQTPFGGNKWHVGQNGLFAEGGATSTKAERIMTTIGYFGSKVYGASQYAIMKGV